LAEALPEAAEQGFVALLDRVYRTGETFFGHELPLEVSPVAGNPPTRRYFSFTHQAYREHGQTVGVSIFAYDVTDQVQARQVREGQQQRLERLFMQAPAAVCILAGPALVFELVNPGYQALFPGRALLGLPLLEALPEVGGHAVARTFQQVYATGITHQELGMLVPLRCPTSGALVDRYFNYMQQARHDEQGRIDGVLAFAFEVTEEVRGRQQVLRLNEELLASNRELGTANEQLTRTNVDLDSFIYAASHDLKEPITNLEGLVETLREVLPPAAAQDALVQPLLGMMEGAVARFQLTIGQLSDVARLQHTADYPAEDVDLATLVQNILLDLAPALTAGAQLTVEVKSCPSVSFAPQHLRSVVYNLLSNALKYADPARPAVVQLRCRREAATAVLEVQDNGLGLDAGQQARLFGLFERLHPHVEGAGVGLYMVRKIVENIGGTVTVRSAPGVGSTFVVTLPCAD
jgi:signal transduction histidine kinase